MSMDERESNPPAFHPGHLADGLDAPILGMEWAWRDHHARVPASQSLAAAEPPPFAPRFPFER